MKLKKWLYISCMTSFLGLNGCDNDASESNSSAICGNGTVEAQEACDDGNTEDGDGCSADCTTIESIPECSEDDDNCKKPEPNTACGNNQIDDNEACDDGNTNDGDGCSADCMTIEAGYSCPEDGGTCTKTEKTDGCGNAIVEEDETCDDGNTNDGDGCSADCMTIEAGYSCPEDGGICSKQEVSVNCGNGILDEGEICDDGNTNDGDGCSHDCASVETGFECSEEGGVCHPAATEKCGNGIVENLEGCDDGNTIDGDGCPANCEEVETGFECPSEGGSCQPVGEKTQCGNGKLEANEKCDDGNTADSDGCSASCIIESGWTCPAPGQSCKKIETALCGNGKLESGETCDDGNASSGDGCSSSCKPEAGWSCPTAGKSCTPIVDDNKKSLKVLAFGGSFTQDSMEYLYDILKFLGYTDLKLAYLYKGGCLLWQHADYLKDNKAIYIYYEISNATKGKWTKVENYKPLDALKQTWDYISLQQGSAFSGISNTYTSYPQNGAQRDDMTYLITNIKKNNSKAKLIWHMTWAYQLGSTHNQFVYYNHSPSTQYNLITQTVKSTVLNRDDFSMVIPTATAIQNLRTSFIGDNITRDGYHLNKANGRLTAALIWAKQLTGKDIKGITNDTFKNTPALKNHSYTNRMLNAIKEAVNNAYAHPYKVTPSKDGSSGNLYKPNTSLQSALKKAGYKLKDYEELPFGLTTHAYYNSIRTDCPSAGSLLDTGIGSTYCTATLVSAETTTKKNITIGAATRIFTRNELPNGTVIVQKTGHKYRPEGWVKLTQANTTRPKMVNDEIVVIDDAWWGDYQYRAFNIGLKDKSSLTEAEMNSLADGIAFFVPKISTNTDKAAKDAGYDLTKYKKLPLDMVYNSYWNPKDYNIINGNNEYSSHVFPVKLHSSSKIAATRIFTKDEIPNGSLIVVTKGHQYRPDAWIDLFQKVSPRPALIKAPDKDSITVVNDAWWSNYRFRAFSIGKYDLPKLTPTEQNQLKDSIAIYVPK